MMCGNCTGKVQRALEAVAGVTSATVDLEDGTATVAGASMDAAMLVDAVEGVGHDCSVQQQQQQQQQQPLPLGMPPAAEPAAETNTGNRVADELLAVTAERDAALAEAAKLRRMLRASLGAAEAAPGGASDVQTRPLLAVDGDDGERVMLSVGGMTCASCSSRVERELQARGGVQSVDVNLILGKAAVAFDPARTTAAEIVAAVTGMGFDAAALDPGGRKPAGPARASEAGGGQPGDDGGGGGVDAEARRWQRLLQISLVFSLPLFLIAMVLPKASEGAAAVLATPVLGYHTGCDVDEAAAVASVGRSPRGGREAVVSMLSGAGEDCVHAMSLGSLLSWILCTPVQFYVGAVFYRQAYAAARHRSTTMDTLVALGTSVAYGYSLCIIFAQIFYPALPGRHCFETAAMLITFLTLGRTLEVRAKGRTSAAIEELMKLQPDEAVLLEMDGAEVVGETTVAVGALCFGDVVKIVPGAKIPLDGDVVFGSSSVDEAMVTGESMPVAKAEGSSVIGGTVNCEGMLRARVTKVGEDTMLAQIVKLVEDAQTSKAPVQRYADKISAVFVPAVMAASLAVTVFWYLCCLAGAVPADWEEHEEEGDLLFSLMFGVSVLVIACPCALGLAVPTAVMVGTGVGAKLGVFIKGGRALEVGSKITAVCFDKTGTLTKGAPSVTDMELLPGGGWGRDEVLQALGAAESNSEHPLAAAIARFAQEELGVGGFGNTEAFLAVPGRGVRCTYAGQRLLVGNLALLAESEPPVDVAAVAPRVHALEEEAKTVVLAAVGAVAVALVGVADEIKPSAAAAVAALRRRGLDVWMVTGDNERCARAIGAQAGLSPERIMAGVLPAEKSAKVAELQRGGAAVAMVGDGVNDSPALARADLGIAIGCGSGVAVETADVVLVRDELTDVVITLDLARTVFRRIRLNFFWALGYNLLGIPIAAGALYPALRTRLPPEVAGAAMAFSSISVISSSLWLRRFRPPKLLTSEPAAAGAPPPGRLGGHRSGHGKYSTLADGDESGGE
jgi:Cu+-exporting ATPase